MPKMLALLVAVVAASGVGVGGGDAFAGTVISSNLPANTYIVNINGGNDGAAGYDGGQNHWYHPFAQTGTALELTLPAGTYTFTVLSPTDAAARFPSLTGSQLAQMGAGWTYNSPWVTDYFVFDSAALSNASLSELFSGGIGGKIPSYASTPGFTGGGWNSAASAYNALVNAGMQGTIYVGGRVTGDPFVSYTLSTSATLVFAVPDYDVLDNQGVLSVLVQPLTPPACQGDINGDHAVNTVDLSLLLGQFGHAVSPVGSGADLSPDGVVDTRDLAVLLGNFGHACP